MRAIALYLARRHLVIGESQHAFVSTPPAPDEPARQIAVAQFTGRPGADTSPALAARRSAGDN